MAQQRLTAGQEKGYVKGYELCVCENKANLSGRACSVPVRAWKGPPNAIHRVWEPKECLTASLRVGLRAKQSQFAGLKVDANAGMGKGL